MTLQQPRKYRNDSPLKPTPILRIAIKSILRIDIAEHAVARIEILKNLVSFSIGG
jgi:hypothetical protein